MIGGRSRLPLPHTGRGLQSNGFPVSFWSQHRVPSSVWSPSSLPPAEDSETPTSLPANLPIQKMVCLFVSFVFVSFKNVHCWKFNENSCQDLTECFCVILLSSWDVIFLVLATTHRFHTSVRCPNTAGTDLCLVSVWAGTCTLPPLRVWSPHRSEFAPLGVASSLAFWGSSEHPTHRPRAPTDTMDMFHCSLRERRERKVL